MRCPRCEHENRPHAAFCEACGTPLSANASGPPGPSYAELTGALSEAREQQTATGEILRVIASSPTDIQPVLDAVAESASRFCQSYDVSIFRVDGDALRLAAHHGPIPQGAVGDTLVPLIRGTAGGRSVLDRQTIHIVDLQNEVDEFPAGSALARRFGHRTIVTVPLLREGVAMGVIQLRRAEVPPFTEKQIAVLHAGRRRERRPSLRSDRFVDLSPRRGASAPGGTAWIATPPAGDRRYHPRQSRHASRTGRARPPDAPRRGRHGGRSGVHGNRVPHEAGCRAPRARSRRSRSTYCGRSPIRPLSRSRMSDSSRSSTPGPTSSRARARS
jgi:hypothetical protein